LDIYASHIYSTVDVQDRPVNIQLRIRPVHNAADCGVVSLVKSSDEYLSALYPPESNHAEPLEALIGPDCVFLAGDFDEQTVACGAIKFIHGDEHFAEIKRLFVAEGYRGNGFASTMMRQLERHARRRGTRVIRLEAGPMQPEALSLYRKHGYVERGPFGAYWNDPLSTFMEKILP